MSGTYYQCWMVTIIERRTSEQRDLTELYQCMLLFDEDCHQMHGSTISITSVQRSNTNTSSRLATAHSNPGSWICALVLELDC